MPHRHSLFTRVANHTARAAGHPATFATAVLVILGWAVLGPVFGYSDTWQLVINTGTTIVTFLMVFLIQSTQNRDSAAMHLKLDEVIRALDGAHNAMLNLEDLEEKDLQAIHRRYVALAERASKALQRGEVDTACEEIEELEDLESAEESTDRAAHKQMPGPARGERPARAGRGRS